MANLFNRIDEWKDDLKGDAAFHQAVLACRDRGYLVSEPSSKISPWDLMLVNPHTKETLFGQVKYQGASAKRIKLHCRPGASRSNKRRMYFYRERGIDLLISVDVARGKIYFVFLQEERYRGKLDVAIKYANAELPEVAMEYISNDGLVHPESYELPI
jgi:hypothetical protein